MEKLVSIIVPVYNVEDYIQQTIKSVVEQSYKNWELLLVDDGSTDHSIEKIKAYCNKDKRIRLVQKTKNEGAAMARNTGVKEATGVYIAFLDGDDLWAPNKLEEVLSFMCQTGAGFVFTAYEFGDESAHGTGKIVHVPEQLTYRQALSRTVIFTSTVVLDTRKIDKTFIHMPNVGSEDTATWWSILKMGHTAYGVDKALAIYRRPRVSLSSNKWVAMKRIWYLYRKMEKIPLLPSIYYFVFWALRAVIRRI